MSEMFLGSETPEKEKQEPERTSGLMKVAGVSKEKEKEILDAIKTDIFDKQKILTGEREKSPEELEIINGILTKIPGFIKEYGGKMPPIRPEHIHVADYSQFTDEEKELIGDTRGRYIFQSEFVSVLVNKKEENNLTFAQRTVHELIHFCGFQSADLEPKKETLVSRIGGFTIRTKEEDKKESYFRDLNEAITEELMKRFDEKFFKTIPALSEYITKREKIRHDEVVGNQSLAIKSAKEIANITTAQEDSGMWKATIEPYNYYKERKKLWEIIEKIKRNNPEQFKSEEDVFNVFTEAYFTGKMLNVARLIEKSYGKGSFRKLGRETKASEIPKPENKE